MEILLAVVLLVVGIVLVAKGGDYFVDAASWIAKAAGIPTFIIGATIVSIATTLPEMIVSVMASAQGSNELAVGNAVGSVTANTAMIMGIAFVFMHVVIKRKEYIVQSLILIVCSAIICIGSLKGELAIWASVLLIVAFLIFMGRNLADGKRHMANAKDDDKEAITGKVIGKNVAMFIGGALGIVIGSRFLVNGGTSLAELLGVPERIIGVTIVAVGTSIPELVTTITAIRKKEHALSVGNIIGANILDLSLILPICSAVSGKPLPVSMSAVRMDLPICLAVTLIGLIPLLLREKADKWHGFCLLGVYVLYLIAVVL